MRKLLEKILDFFFPFYCLGCRKEDSTICDECLGGVEFLGKCEIEVADNMLSKPDANEEMERCASLDELWAVFDYKKSPFVVKALHLWKYNYQSAYGKRLKEFLAMYCCSFLIKETEMFGKLASGKMVISFVPMADNKKRERGFNQAEVLAGGIQDGLKSLMKGLPAVQSKNFLKCLLVKNLTPGVAQMTLKAAERIKNIQGTFTAAKGIIDWPTEVLLVDDVATTLSTLNEAAKTLKRAGVKKVYGVVLARHL